MFHRILQRIVKSYENMKYVSSYLATHSWRLATVIFTTPACSNLQTLMKHHSL